MEEHRASTRIILAPALVSPVGAQVAGITCGILADVAIVVDEVTCRASTRSRRCGERSVEIKISLEVQGGNRSQSEMSGPISGDLRARARCTQKTRGANKGRADGDIVS